MDKITFEDLLAKKLQRERDKEAILEIEVPSIGKTLIFNRLPEVEILRHMDGINAGAGLSEALGIYAKIIYDSCRFLHNPELHKSLDIADPYEVVEAVFDMNDILSIGDKLVDFNGLGKVNDKIKNS